MKSSQNNESPTPTNKPESSKPASNLAMTDDELRRDTLKKLAAMDPRKREQLLRLERLRRGLPVTVIKP